MANVAGMINVTIVVVDVITERMKDVVKAVVIINVVAGIVV